MLLTQYTVDEFVCQETHVAQQLVIGQIQISEASKDAVYEKKMDMGLLDKQDSVLFHFSANYYIS